MKKAVYSAADATGLSSAVAASFWRTRRLLVLCWHGISLDDEHQWQPGLFISPRVFRNRLETIRQMECSVLPLSEALDRLWSGSLPPRSVAITFDDGFFDFYANAAPMLQEFGFPATLYLTTYYVDNRLPLFNLITSYMLWKSTGPKRRLRDGTPLASPEDMRAAHARILSDSENKGLTGTQKDERARALADDLGIDYEALRAKRILQLVSAEDVRRMISPGLITIEAHTHRHRTPTEAAMMLGELRENQERIREITGRRPEHFCYPSGVYRREYFPLLEQTNFRSATTCESGMARQSGHRFLTPRFLDHSGVSQTDFQGWLTGVRAIGRRA